MTRYTQKFHEGCAKLGYNSFPTPTAMLSKPYNGRSATVLSAFIPLPINFSLPDKPQWGKAMKDADRQFFNYGMGVGIVMHDLPQETNRVELDDTVKDAWGPGSEPFCRRRI